MNCELKQGPTMERRKRSGRADSVYEWEAAELLGMTEPELIQLRQSGRGPVFCNCRPVVYLTADIENWKANKNIELETH